MHVTHKGYMPRAFCIYPKLYSYYCDVLHGLHWLPIHQRIAFRIMTLTFKSLHDLAPQYLTELVTPYRPKRSLRSAKKDLLNLPKMSLKRYGYSSFHMEQEPEENTRPTCSINQHPSLLEVKVVTISVWLDFAI